MFYYSGLFRWQKPNSNDIRHKRIEQLTSLRSTEEQHSGGERPPGVSRCFFSLLLFVCGLGPACCRLAASMRGGWQGQPLDTMGAEGRGSLQGSAEEFLKDSQKPGFGHMSIPRQGGEAVIGRSAKRLSSLNLNSSENRDNHRPYLTELL